MRCTMLGIARIVAKFVLTLLFGRFINRIF
jgi:hypothetical protein